MGLPISQPIKPPQPPKPNTNTTGGGSTTIPDIPIGPNVGSGIVFTDKPIIGTNLLGQTTTTTGPNVAQGGITTGGSQPLITIPSVDMSKGSGNFGQALVDLPQGPIFFAADNLPPLVSVDQKKVIVGGVLLIAALIFATS